MDSRLCGHVGTSAGAVVGAAPASGADPRALHERELRGAAPSTVPAPEYGDPLTRADVMSTGPQKPSDEILAALLDPTDGPEDRLRSRLRCALTTADGAAMPVCVRSARRGGPKETKGPRCHSSQTSATCWIVLRSRT
ncbi:hypothetical protein GCM10020366_49370 [Saccharopolyspora gregorii]|uniref:Uncharacterized protein n=1 Tax=Saccharopolyspora gregorii TaxID=33914 RepID=A0ABP6RWX2_9PSEU